MKKRSAVCLLALGLALLALSGPHGVLGSAEGGEVATRNGAVQARRAALQQPARLVQEDDGIMADDELDGDLNGDDKPLFGDEDGDGGDAAVGAQAQATTGAQQQTQAAAATTATGGQQQAAAAAAGKGTRIVSVAPEANVTNDDDVDSKGKCAPEVAKACADVEIGEGRLAECLSALIAVGENPETGDGADTPTPVSDACREEVYQYKITRNSNINKNVPLAKACKVDAEKLCNTTWFFGYQSGLVIACLRENKGQLSKGCKKEITKVQLDAAEDIRSDPALWEACKDEAATYCKDVKFGGGRVQACLRDNRMKLSWACDDQLFRQEIENADDIRLSVRLYAKCMPDKRKFCKDVEPGHARTKDCLESHRLELSDPCRGEIDSMIERRSRDFRLDTKLKEACEAEITNMCAFFGDVDDMDTYDSSVINCLQDYSAEIKASECKRQVKKYMELAAQDIRFDVTLAEACYEDRQKFCAAVPPGSARVIRCLSKKRDQLSAVCRVTLFDEEVRFSENIDFQYPMKEACSAELAKFCKDVPHGNARAIRCLQDHKNEKDFGKSCRSELSGYEAEISKDYRLNYRLANNCAKDVAALCANLCASTDGSVCGGKVLRCLTDKLDEIKAEACKKEVFYYQKMEVENFQNDIILADACRTDVEKFCINVEPGEGRVHQCLRDHRKKLSEMCRKEEMLLEQKEASNIELNTGLLRACKVERHLFCRDVRPGGARVFRCLAENMNDADFGAKCRDQVMGKLQRRQANWKLDPPLRKACRTDVASLCSADDTPSQEEGRVYKCLIRNVATISPGCQRELGRAVHMALYVWQPEAILTSECDQDIQNYCLKARPNMADRPGAVGSCLARILERQDAAPATVSRRALVEGKATAKEDTKDSASPASGKDDDALPRVSGADDAAAATNAVAATIGGGRLADGAGPDGNDDTPRSTAPTAGARLSDKCYILADIAEPPNMKRAFDASLSFAALKTQLDKLDAAVGSVGLVNRSPRGHAESISLTGWVAMLGMAALVTLVAYGGFVVYKRWRGIPDTDGYTLVVKPQRK